MWSPITNVPPNLSATFISPPPKWLDSDDDFEHEPALISDDALSSSCSRAPSLAPLDSEDPHIDIVSSPVQDTFFRAYPSSRAAPLSRYNKPHPSNHTKPSTTREDVAAALLALRAQPRLSSSSRPALPNVMTQPAAVQTPHHPPPRRSRVVSPSLRNLVLPRTPSPPPRAPLPMTNCPPIIDLGNETIPLAHTSPPPRRTPVSSPLPPSSPFAEEDEYEGSAPTRFHSLSSPTPKSEHLETQVHILPPDNSDTDICASPSRDREPNSDSHLIIPVELIPASSLTVAPSLIPGVTPDESPLVHERVPLLPLASRSDTCTPPLSSLPDTPADSSPVPVLDPTSVAPAPQTPLSAPTTPPDEKSERSHASLPRLSASAPPMDVPDTTDSENAIPSPTSPPPVLDPDPDDLLSDIVERRTASPTPSPQRSQPASSPLSSPPSSPSPEQRRAHIPSPSPAPASPSPPCTAGTKRPSPEETDDRDIDAESDAESPSASAPSAVPARARSKRRRRDANTDDKPWRDRKKHLPVTSSTPSSSTSTAPSPSPTTSSHDAAEPCPHPALLFLLLETLALSRASTLTQTALIRTNPSLTPRPTRTLLRRSRRR
ncbi:hypothetical protein EI94DRAFT_1829056 [Lactarius quietus]|nr:hypothetical protein EI94DRAFT_1829056 [Lactarius quietus]